MKFFKRYFTLLLPIITLLISWHIYQYIDKLMSTYIDNVNQNYSIVIIASKPVTQKRIESLVSDVSEVKRLDVNTTVSKFKSILSKENFAQLSNKLPYFYQLKLSVFPDKEDILSIKKKLKSYNRILKVETFLKKHSSFTTMFITTQKIVNFFFVIVVILSVLLLSKLIQVWHFEQNERMEIMKLFGASLWERSIFLVKVAFINAMMASLIVSLSFYYIYQSAFAYEFLSALKLEHITISFDILHQIFYSFMGAFVISAFILVFVIIKHR